MIQTPIIDRLVEGVIPLPMNRIEQVNFDFARGHSVWFRDDALQQFWSEFVQLWMSNKKAQVLIPQDEAREAIAEMEAAREEAKRREDEDNN